MLWKLISHNVCCSNQPKVVARLLANRGVVEDSDSTVFFSDDVKSGFWDPKALTGIDLAARIIAAAILSGKHIRVIGDYDCDGVCATTILVRGLRAVGANVDYDIPHRVTDGYGLNVRLINEAHAAGVDVIITCDNGISAVEAVALAKSYGMVVVVTDHHEVPYSKDESGNSVYRLPDADAIVDPKRPDSDYPFKEICGAFVAYKFIRYMYDNRLLGDTFHGVYCDPVLDDVLMQYAALATVCDVMELRSENRALLKFGLKRMTESPAWGVRHLIDERGLRGKTITAYHLGFVIGPCVNAVGRLGSAEMAARLMLCSDEAEAKRLAHELSEYNMSRIKMTEDAQAQAEALMDDRKVQVIFLPDCHESIVGIVAGRLKDKYHRPFLVCTRTDEGLCKGSGRSILAYSMYHELTKIQDIFLKYGGHAFAAGFSLELSRLDELRDRLNANCTLTDEDVEGELVIDAPLRLNEITDELVDIVSSMAPFGHGNRKPMFVCRGLRLKSMRAMGKDGKSARLRVLDGVNEYEVTSFGMVDALVDAVQSRYAGTVSDTFRAGVPLMDPMPIDIVYSLGWNDWGGKKAVQVTLEDFHVLP